ncbi:MAG: DMT family transporter [Spirochaetota bacterium]
MPRPTRLAAESLLVLATIIWGGTFVATRAGLDYVSPTLIIAIRFLASFLILAPALALAGRAWWRHAKLGAVLGVVLAGGYILQTVGLQFTTAARSAFLTYLFAILIPPLQLLVSRKPLSAGNLAGLFVVFAGTALLTHPWTTGGWNAGDLVTIASAVCFGLFIVLIDRFAQDVPAIDLVPVQFLVAGSIALAGAVFIEPMVFVRHPAMLVTVGYLTLLGTVGGLGLQTVFQVYSTPVRATTIYALEPVFAAIFGVVLLAERVGPIELAGGAVILAGVLLSELWEHVIRRRSARVDRADRPAPPAHASVSKRPAPDER